MLSYISQLFLILINLLVLASCASNFLFQTQETEEELISVEKPDISYEFKALPKKINIIYSNSKDYEARNFIKGMSVNYFYYKNLKYNPELNFLDSKSIEETNCSIRNYPRTYLVLFLNSKLHQQLSKNCLEKLIKLNGILVLSDENWISSNPNLIKFKVDRKEDYIDLLYYAKNQGSLNAIIIDDEKTEDRDKLSQIWKNLDGRTIKSSKSENNQNEELLSDLLLIENSKVRALKLSRTLSLPIESTPRRRRDIDSLILSVSLSRARSLKPALEFNFGESLSVYLSPDWRETEYYEDKEMDLEGVTLIDMPWMLNASSDIEIDMQRSRSRNYATGYDVYELILLLNNPSSKRNFTFKGMSGKISLKAGKLKRQSLKIEVKKGEYKFIGY